MPISKSAEYDRSSVPAICREGGRGAQVAACVFWETLRPFFSLHEGAGFVVNGWEGPEHVPATTSSAKEVEAEITDINIRRRVQHRKAASNAGPIPGRNQVGHASCAR